MQNLLFAKLWIVSALPHNDAVVNVIASIFQKCVAIHSLELN
ncbi:hypothetical protein [Helicobacter sp.]|nr:hypothetical protein [Helicobacter sp.]